MKKKESIFYEANSFPSPGPEILDHMKYLLSEGKEEVMPKDVYLRMGFKANQKEAKNISKTMERISKDGSIKSGITYGNYSLLEIKTFRDDIV